MKFLGLATIALSASQATALVPQIKSMTTSVLPATPSGAASVGGLAGAIAKDPSGVAEQANQAGVKRQDGLPVGAVDAPAHKAGDTVSVPTSTSTAVANVGATIPKGPNQAAEQVAPAGSQLLGRSNTVQQNSTTMADRYTELTALMKLASQKMAAVLAGNKRRDVPDMSSGKNATETTDKNAKYVQLMDAMNKINEKMAANPNLHMDEKFVNALTSAMKNVIVDVNKRMANGTEMTKRGINETESAMTRRGANETESAMTKRGINETEPATSMTMKRGANCTESDMSKMMKHRNDTASDTKLVQRRNDTDSAMQMQRRNETDAEMKMVQRRNDTSADVTKRGNDTSSDSAKFVQRRNETASWISKLFQRRNTMATAMKLVQTGNDTMVKRVNDTASEMTKRMNMNSTSS